jgi:hypothetical protein
MLDREDTDPVPQGYRFGVVWRGFDRGQVKGYPNMELGTLITDLPRTVRGLLVRANALVNSLVRS